ncbi:MAG: PAS domain S-box protein [Ignavibacteriales bacterium]
MNEKPSILIACGDETLSKGLADVLKIGGLNSRVVNTRRDAIQNLEEKFFHVVLADVSLPGNSGIEILSDIKSIYSDTEVILTAEPDSPGMAVEALTEGAFAYVEKPLNLEYVVMVVLKALEKQQLRLQSERRLNQISSLLGATEDMNSELHINQLLRQLVKRALVLTESERGSIALLQGDKVVMREFWDGEGWQDLSHSEGTQIETPGGSAEEKKMGVSFTPLPCLRSYVSVPIVDRKGGFLGIIEVCNKRGEDFSHSDDTQLLEGLARTAAIAIENLRLYEGLKIKSLRLEESEQKYRTLAQDFPDLIFVVQNNKLKFINTKTSETMLYSPEELYGFNVSDLIYPPYRDIFMRNIKMKLRGEGVPNYELMLINKNGSAVVLDVSSLLTEYGGMPAVQFIGRDVTGRKKADEEMLRLGAAVKSLNSAVTITDMNRNITYINPAHKKVFGYDLGELVGKQNNILYPFDDPSGISNRIYEAVLMVGWEGERLGMRKNGEVFPVYEKTSVVKDKDGRQIAIVSVVEDISLRKRLEQALRESEERYRTLVETAKSAIISIDKEGMIMLFNPAAEELFGYSIEEVKDKELTILMPERYRDLYRAGLKSCIETGISDILGKTIEFLGLKKSGDEFPIEASISACKIGGHTVFTAIIFDITERKNLQEQLIQSEKMAAVGQLISGVTHEINNPLTVVMGYAEVLLSEPNLDKGARKALQAIYDESNRCKKVVQNLLSFARKHSPDREYAYINEVLERTLSLKEYDLRKNKVEVIKNLEMKLPALMVDPNQIQQVFLNLINNAEQAMAENDGGRQLVIESRIKNGENRVNPEGEVIIEVSFSDSGPGISSKNLKKIFDPFFTTKPVGKGTGLGLSVSYGIIKEHGGEIYALSEEGRGATFIIELPMVKEIN